MRLIFFHERMGAFGGAEANILLTAGALRDRGHTVALVHGPGTGRGEAEWSEVFGERIPWTAEVGGETGLKTALEGFRPDVIFVHKISDPAALHVLAAGETPVVRMVHDHDLYCMRSYKYNVFSRRICTRGASPYCIFPCGASLGRGGVGGLPLRWISYRAKRREIALNRGFQRLIVATGYMRDELLRNGFSEEQIEIHAPVPRDTRAAEVASFGPRNRIVYAGQIVRGKGVDVLLKSLACVSEPFECIIIGDGSHRPACERLRDRLGLQAKVQFTGFLPQARIAEYYREASLSVMSSLWPEPFGATGLEAIRCGLPVVAFDAGGIREWLLDGINGFLVPWMDRDAYAGRIELLLRDKALARSLGENGRRLAAINAARRMPERRGCTLCADRGGTIARGRVPVTARANFPFPPMLKKPAIDPRFVENWDTFQSGVGRWRLRTRVVLRRLVWHCVVGGANALKRLIDIVVSAVALILLSPLLLVIAAIIKLDGGPVIFTQTRVARWGREFRMFKFRSMRPDAEARLAALLAANQHADGVTFKLKHDPRITRIGHYLRRYSLDELPQFYNVFIGDMSLVGPRPPVPREVALYSLADRRRLAVQPGITCIWQISGRAEIDFKGQVSLDVRYIESQSLAQDLRILVRTIPAVIFGSGAY